jgi:hypothetical protein
LRGKRISISLPGIGAAHKLDYSTSSEERQSVMSRQAALDLGSVKAIFSLSLSSVFLEYFTGDE